MDVTGSHYRLIKRLSQLHNLPVDFLKVFLCLNIITVRIPEHKGVVSNGLDFQIIIEIYDSGNLSIWSAV